MLPNWIEVPGSGSGIIHLEFKEQFLTIKTMPYDDELVDIPLSAIPLIAEYLNEYLRSKKDA